MVRGKGRHRRWAGGLAALALVAQLVTSIAVGPAKAQVNPPPPPQPTLEQASVTQRGGDLAQGNNRDSTISADGRWVAFTSSATNMPGATDNRETLYVF